jgi:hypothetical protein
MTKWFIFLIGINKRVSNPLNPDVIDRIWYEFQGQPGLTCWFGELLTETYNQATDQPITMSYFEGVYAEALDLLPNNNILNIISKAKQEPYKSFVLELFQTKKPKFNFTYDDPIINFLYMNGVISMLNKLAFWQKLCQISLPIHTKAII